MQLSRHSSPTNATIRRVSCNRSWSVTAEMIEPQHWQVGGIM